MCSWINGGNSTCSRRGSVKRGGLSRAGPGVPASLPFFLLHTSSTLTCSWLSRHSSPASCALALLPGGWALSPPGKLLPSFQAAQAWPQASNPATQPCPQSQRPSSVSCVLLPGDLSVCPRRVVPERVLGTLLTQVPRPLQLGASK